MSNTVFIEEHLKDFLESFVCNDLYIPGVIVGQVIGENYHVVHLSTMNILNEDTNTSHSLIYHCLTDLLTDSHLIFQKSLEVVNLLPGGSHVLGLFFIIPKDLKNGKPVIIDFHEFNKLLVENPLCDKNKTWNYLQINYSTVHKKSYCYAVDFNSVTTPIKTTYKLINSSFGSFDNDWVTLVGKFNFEALERFNLSGGPKALISIRENLLDKLESILNESVCTFNGNICDENKTLKDFECNAMDELLTNVIDIEFYRKLDRGNEYKKASLKVERGKGKVLLSGLCSLAVPFNRNGTIKSAIKAIHEDAMRTFTIRLNMHLQLLVEEESIEEEDEDSNIVHETPRRILILKTEGSRFAFSDYVFPGEAPHSSLIVAGDILNLSEQNMKLYDDLERGRHPYYETLSDMDNSLTQDTIAVTTKNNIMLYLSSIAVLIVVIGYSIAYFYPKV